MALQTAVVGPGECVILPAGATISSIIVDGSATATSSCGDLPAPSAYRCGLFFLIVDADDNTGHSMDTDTTYQSLKVGNTTYIINEPIMFGDDNTPTPTSVATLNLHITNLALFEFMAITENEVTSRSHLHVYFRIPADLWDTMALTINNNGVNSLMIPVPVDAVCGVYEDPA